MSTQVKGPAPGASDRLVRLLAMVPFVIDHQGLSVGEIADHFEITESQVIKDLELLFVCGTPGHLPDDLIEAEWESGSVRIGNADAIARPLRLSVDEIAALLPALESLRNLPGIDHTVVDEALSALKSAYNADLATLPKVHVAPGSQGRHEVFETVQRALAEECQVQVAYFTPGRDAVDERTLEPWRLFQESGHWYLDSFCLKADAHRRFRMDRIINAHQVDHARQHPIPADIALTARAEGAAGSVIDTTSTQEVIWRLGPGAYWVAETYPCTILERSDGGLWTVAMQVADPQWALRLALRLGNLAQITHPADLQAEVQRVAHQALQQYGARKTLKN